MAKDYTEAKQLKVPEELRDDDSERISNLKKFGRAMLPGQVPGMIAEEMMKNEKIRNSLSKFGRAMLPGGGVPGMITGAMGAGVEEIAKRRPGMMVEETAKRRPAEMKKGGKVKMASGGKVSSASKRADGICKKGKTKGRFV